jgi:anti-sigma B factor antagonist
VNVVYTTIGETVRLTISEDVDMNTAGGLRRVLRRLINDPATRRIEVDLSHLRFCDSSGLAVFVGADRLAKATGTDLLFLNPRKQLRLILAIAGLTDILTIGRSGSGSTRDQPAE